MKIFIKVILGWLIKTKICNNSDSKVGICNNIWFSTEMMHAPRGDVRQAQIARNIVARYVEGYPMFKVVWRKRSWITYQPR